MKTRSPRSLHLDLNRTVAQSPSLGIIDHDLVPGRAGTGSPARGPGCFGLTVSPGPDLHPKTPVPGQPEPVGPREKASALTLYIREIRQIPLLQREEEAALARRAQAGDAAAREVLIKANLRLVVKIARDFGGLGLPLLDLISDGNIGLMKAVDRYDPAKGAKLSVYASFWIKQHMRRALSNSSRTIRVPVSAQDKFYATRSVFFRLQELLGRDPACDEIGLEVGVPAAWVRSMREAMQNTISLDTAMEDRGERPLVETIADEHCPAPDETLAQASRLERLWHFIDQLDRRERIVLRSRFGLEGEEETTLRDIGRQLGLTHERVRQIQNSALTKLRRRLLDQEGRPRVVQSAPAGLPALEPSTGGRKP
jgi:RNA polymerase primary sigma factor